MPIAGQRLALRLLAADQAARGKRADSFGGDVQLVAVFGGIGWLDRRAERCRCWSRQVRGNRPSAGSRQTRWWSAAGRARRSGPKAFDRRRSSRPCCRLPSRTSSGHRRVESSPLRSLLRQRIRLSRRSRGHRNQPNQRQSNRLGETVSHAEVTPHRNENDASLPGLNRTAAIRSSPWPAALTQVGPIPSLRKCGTLGEWCNGSTTDSGSVSLGSNPSSPVFASSNRKRT